MTQRLKKLIAASGLALATGMPGAAFAQAGIFDMQEGVNVVFLGVGSAPDFMGSDDNEMVPAIMGRMHFGKTRRFIQLMGPQLSLNLIDSEEWQFGPQLIFRPKRDSDVDSPVVRRMREVDSEVEAGAFIARSWKLSSDPRHKVNVRADLQVGEGTFGTVTANIFFPASQQLVLNFGGGISYANDKWTNHYFGINGTDIALYPTQGGRPYNAGGGVYDFRLNAGAIYHLSKSWHVGGGLRYAQIQGDAKDSPIVSQQGNRDQWIFGVAVGYAWQ